MRVKVPPIRALARRAPINWEGFDEAFWLQNISNATWARTQQHANDAKRKAAIANNDDDDADDQLEQDDDPDADDDDALRSLAPTELQSKQSVVCVTRSCGAFWKPLFELGVLFSLFFCECVCSFVCSFCLPLTSHTIRTAPFH